MITVSMLFVVAALLCVAACACGYSMVKMRDDAVSVLLFWGMIVLGFICVATTVTAFQVLMKLEGISL